MSEPSNADKETVGRVTGVGGVFFKSQDPKALAAWYRDVLGVVTEPWGGAILMHDAPGAAPMLVWTPFPATTAHFAPSTREYMVNYAVDNMDAILARIAARGIEILQRDDSDPNGRFAWLMDPEGNKIELWEPKGD